jgi:hypothetical protein
VKVIQPEPLTKNTQLLWLLADIYYLRSSQNLDDFRNESETATEESSVSLPHVSIDGKVHFAEQVDHIPKENNSGGFEPELSEILTEISSPIAESKLRKYKAATQQAIPKAHSPDIHKKGSVNSLAHQQSRNVIDFALSEDQEDKQTS